ncbi:MAG TPA: hypothetical protein VN809_04075 [Telmatospirillum sp.]|nr:hypothetical protein [Telmatospirillum sp.]
MRYLWTESVKLENSKLIGFLGGEINTPLNEAVRATLVEIGCLTAMPCCGHR